MGDPFGKMSIVGLFEILVFIAQKDIFLSYIAKKKSWKNGHYWAKTMGKMEKLQKPL